MMALYTSLALSAFLSDVAAEPAPRPAVPLALAGQRWSYAGRLVPAGPDADDASLRTFRISFVLVDEGGDAAPRRLIWLLEELRGTPRWPWSKRFGTVPINQSFAATSDRELPAIQAERDGNVQAVRLRLPLYAAADRLKAGAEWDENRLHFQVAGREQVAGRQCWKVVGSSNLGLREIDWVDEQDRLLVKHQQAVFLGQGIAHELVLELEKADTLGDDDLVRLTAAHTALAEFRGPLREPLSEQREVGPPASPSVLEHARSKLKTIQDELKTGAYVELARDMVREIQDELNRQEAVKKLAAAIVGKPAPDFTLPTTTGGKVALRPFIGKPVVLHFWEYRSEPKVAPYGETGYLDFLARQREKQGVRVVGVAVLGRLSGDRRGVEGLGKAHKDVRAFCEFMNLSYPVAFDADQSVIKSFGDPREVGAKLPLYVVIAPDGTVAEYHVGFWGSSRVDEGLKELDQRLLKLVP